MPLKMFKLDELQSGAKSGGLHQHGHRIFYHLIYAFSAVSRYERPKSRERTFHLLRKRNELGGG